MSETLSKDDVAKVAKLAMLELTDEELASFTPQLAAILDHASDMEALDVADVPPTAHPYPLVNVFRDDVVEQHVDVRDEALAAGPDVEDHRFKVPPALGEEP
ncbi:MAG: Asp-tRNA(Asn)/Glu-tRNA(Gln) amidotransferase subunit GatC [Acidimicrobiales bacterium]